MIPGFGDTLIPLGFKLEPPVDAVEYLVVGANSDGDLGEGEWIPWMVTPVGIIFYKKQVKDESDETTAAEEDLAERVVELRARLEGAAAINVNLNKRADRAENKVKELEARVNVGHQDDREKIQILKEQGETLNAELRKYGEKCRVLESFARDLTEGKYDRVDVAKWDAMKILQVLG